MRQGDAWVRAGGPGTTAWFFDIKYTNPLTRPRVEEAVVAARRDQGTVNPILAGSSACCALDAAFAAKNKKHRAAVERAGGIFSPIIISTLGMVHPDSLAALHVLSDQLAIRSGLSRDASFAALRLRLSICFARNTGELLRHSLAPQDVPSCAPPAGAAAARARLSGGKA